MRHWDVGIGDKDELMYLYDEEISDILSAYGVRMLRATLKTIAIAAVLCIGLTICRGWISSIPVTKLSLIARDATAAARQATATLAAATRDAWLETTTELHAQDPSRP